MTAYRFLKIFEKKQPRACQTKSEGMKRLGGAGEMFILTRIIKQFLSAP